MSEASWALRIALLLIGAAVVAGIYLFAIARRRQRNRHYGGMTQRRNAAAAERDTEFDSAEDEVIAVRVLKIDPLPDLPAVRNDADDAPRPITAPLEPDPDPAQKRVGRRPRAQRKVAQLDFGFDDSPSGRARRSARQGPPPEATLLMLYMQPSHEASFTGPSIVRNLNAVGMRHGARQIFHHHGAGDLRTEQALFSLANMFEPGSFDLQRIEAFETAGLVMFLNLPAVLDGPVAFELFLNTAQRIAEGLRADLLSQPGTALDTACIDAMRRTAASYVHHVE